MQIIAVIQSMLLKFLPSLNFFLISLILKMKAKFLYLFDRQSPKRQRWNHWYHCWGSYTEECIQDSDLLSVSCIETVILKTWFSFRFSLSIMQNVVSLICSFEVKVCTIKSLSKLSLHFAKKIIMSLRWYHSFLNL